MSSSLTEFKNALATEIYGMTTAEAVTKGICIQCKEPALPKCYSGDGKQEYAISGLCELCFDDITKEDDDGDF